MLFAGSGSGVDAVTLTVFVTVPALEGLTTMVTMAERDGSIVPRAQVTRPSDLPPPARVQDPCIAVADTNVTSGNWSVRVTPLAAPEPRLLTVIVDQVRAGGNWIGRVTQIHTEIGSFAQIGDVNVKRKVDVCRDEVRGRDERSHHTVRRQAAADRVEPSSPAAIRSVTPVRRLRRKTSYKPLVSSATRFVARELKTTHAPSSLTKGVSLSSSAWTPAVLRFTILVVPSWRSLRTRRCRMDARRRQTNPQR